VEEWKDANAQLYLMLWADPVVRSMSLDALTGKKEVVAETVEEAEGKLKEGLGKGKRHSVVLEELAGEV